VSYWHLANMTTWLANVRSQVRCELGTQWSQARTNYVESSLRAMGTQKPLLPADRSVSFVKFRTFLNGTAHTRELAITLALPQVR
jgi:hypothetical protein